VRHDSYEKNYDIESKGGVQAAIRKQCEQMLANSAPLAISVLVELAESASSESVRFQAASSLLDRTGFKNPVQVEIKEYRTMDEVDAELQMLLGIIPSEKDKATH